MTDILSIIQDITSAKQEAHTEPSYALEREILDKVIQDTKKELNNLYKEGKIEVGKTLNNKYIKLK
jgi:hypothetical protein